MTTDTPPVEKPNYKHTLNLPQTSFAMRANLAQSEPESIKRWTAARLYEQLMAGADERPRFNFHDGPPYANADIHVGHLLNKVLKDLVVRSRWMMGQSCPYVPGWDCHGLPIEHMVMTRLVEKGKMAKLAELPDDTRRMIIRRECQQHAQKFVTLQGTQLQRLLTLGDYDHPYMTMAKEYERETLEVFAALVANGLVSRSLKPVHWSMANQTALAEAELEYKDREDPSIYVHFTVEDDGDLAQRFSLAANDVPGDASIMIWTTTPWTIPANLAVAVHPRYR